MKRLILILWAVLLLSMVAFTVYADTVKPPEGVVCEMYYDEEGAACYPRSCDYHPHFPKVGDKYVDENGEVWAVVTDVFDTYNEKGQIDGFCVGSDVLFEPSWRDVKP